MVSRRKPERPVAGQAGSQGLAAFLELSRTELYEPWQASLAIAPDLAQEIDATVTHLRVFFEKWVVEILIVLSQRPSMRFNELKARLAGISGRTLSHRLKELEKQGLIVRTMFDEMPVRVEYALTSKGRDVALLALPLVVYLRSAVFTSDAD
ncbi:MAG: winged helix-turn-helix transcriptional regulator [Thermoplasmatota archaeon]